MQQRTVTWIIILGLVCCCIVAVSLYRKEDFSQLAPATYLGWSGTKWDICDDANRTRGLDSVPGGICIVSDVVAIDVVGESHIIGKDAAGNWFLITVDEWGFDDVALFTSEPQWRDALNAAGLSAPSLRDPSELYR